MNTCINKMDTLKRRYKQIKDHNNQSGNNRKTCPYYEELDELFRKKPWIKPLTIAGSNMPLTDINNYAPSVSASKRPRSALEEHKIAYLEQSLEENRLKREATEVYRNQKICLMEELVKTNKVQYGHAKNNSQGEGHRFGSWNCLKFRPVP